jgi:F0F1-type ATP synthase membrane subunit b/b'
MTGAPNDFEHLGARVGQILTLAHEEAEAVAARIRDAAEREAAARLRQADAVVEDQRAKAAAATADFEDTLASRRTASERELADARREARRLVEEAQRQASTIVGEAEATAARIREESERKLASDTQRRDLINAQLADVRQMLAALTGGTEPTPHDAPDEEPAVGEDS